MANRVKLKFVSIQLCLKQSKYADFFLCSSDQSLPAVLQSDFTQIHMPLSDTSLGEVPLSSSSLSRDPTLQLLDRLLLCGTSSLASLSKCLLIEFSLLCVTVCCGIIFFLDHPQSIQTLPIVHEDSKSFQFNTFTPRSKILFSLRILKLTVCKALSHFFPVILYILSVFI